MLPVERRLSGPTLAHGSHLQVCQVLWPICISCNISHLVVCLCIFQPQLPENLMRASNRKKLAILRAQRQVQWSWRHHGRYNFHHEAIIACRKFAAPPLLCLNSATVFKSRLPFPRIVAAPGRHLIFPSKSHPVTNSKFFPVFSRLLMATRVGLASPPQTSQMSKPSPAASMRVATAWKHDPSNVIEPC